MAAALAFLLKNWKAVAAAAAAVLVFLALSALYEQGRKEGYAAAHAKWSAKYAADQLQRQKDEEARREAAKQAENEFYRRQAMHDAEQAKELQDWQQKAKGYEDYIAGIKDDSACLLGDDVGRLRDLWHHR